MRGYDEYEDLDEYEEEGEEEEEEGVGGEEYEEKVAPKPTKEELEYLELRQRLKESIRKQRKKESSSSYSQEKKKLPFDNYGSFFGPSQPVIAQRVIQESKSLLENQHLAAKVSTPRNGNNKSIPSTTAGSKPRVNNQPPKVVNEVRAKVQKLKNTRDYSFLLSDDAELPAKKDPPRNISVPHSEARSAQGPPKSKQISNPGRGVLNGHADRKSLSTERQMQQVKMGSHKLASASKPKLTSIDSRKQLGSNSANGPGRPPLPKSLPSKSPSATVEKKLPPSGAKSAVPMRKPQSSKLSSSAPKQPLERKKESYESSKGKIMPKQPVSSSKPQITKPPAKISHGTSHVDRPKKKPVRRYSDEDDDDEGGKAISLIRRMFNYNPGRYDDPDDDSDMEANFDDIMREEKRSAKIARKEDEEELRKIEEEERREWLRKEAKKRKLSQR